jgi:16S rRNA processing protein RimM
MSTILIGKILTSHGIKGYIKVESYTENPKEIFDYDLFDANNKRYKITFKGNLKPNIFIAELEGITDPETAKEFRNTELFADLDDDEIYLDELIGLKVKATDNQFTGTIMSVENYGAGNVVEIKWSDEKIESIPFSDEYFKEVSKNFVVVERPKFV